MFFFTLAEEFGAGAMNWTIDEPLAIWPRFWLALAGLFWASGFFLDWEYSSKVPRIGTFFLFLSEGAGFELDFRRWRVLPFFLDDRIVR